MLNHAAMDCIQGQFEAVVQTSLGYSGKPFSWAETYLGLHVFAFNLLQLYIFRRYDFASLYSLRLVYYLYWHILWSTLRLY